MGYSRNQRVGSGAETAKEPTTGLDASCALMLGRVMAQLAEAERKRGSCTLPPLVRCAGRAAAHLQYASAAGGAPPSLQRKAAAALSSTSFLDRAFWFRLDLGQFGDQLTKTTDPWLHKDASFERQAGHQSKRHVAFWRRRTGAQSGWCPTKGPIPVSCSHALSPEDARLGQNPTEEGSWNVADPALVAEIKRAVSRHRKAGVQSIEGSLAVVQAVSGPEELWLLFWV